MKRQHYLLFFLTFILFSCDYQGEYVFRVENSTEDTITMVFSEQTYSYRNRQDTVIILPAEEKVIITVDAPLNNSAHDCLHQHGITYFNELVFDTYVNGEKLEIQLWQPDNWTYRKKGKWSAEYRMTITNQSLGQ